MGEVPIPDCITIRWDVLFGDACLSGTRIPIKLIRRYSSTDDFCRDYGKEDRRADIEAIRSLAHRQLIAIGMRERKELRRAKKFWG